MTYADDCTIFFKNTVLVRSLHCTRRHHVLY